MAVDSGHERDVSKSNISFVIPSDPCNKLFESVSSDEKHKLHKLLPSKVTPNT